MISVKIESRQLERALKMAPIEIRKKAVVAAINRTATMTRTQMKREIAKEGKIPQKLVTAGLPVKKANYRKPYAEIIPTGQRISMTKLNPRQTRSGVRAGKHFRQSAFIPKIKRQPVFKRSGQARLPIVKQTVSGVRAIASRRNITAGTQRFAERKLKERTIHELKYRLRKLGLR